MALSNGFGGAAGGAGGGPPASHGSTHRPAGTDPLGSMAGQSFASDTPPSAVSDGSVWIPTSNTDPLRGRWLKWHAWRNSTSGRWVSEPWSVEFGSDNADGSFLELAAVGPSAELGFPIDEDALVIGIRASRANDGPTTKQFYLIIDGNIGSPLYGPFAVNKGTVYNICSLDVPIPSGSVLGVRASADGDPCMAAVAVEVAWRRDP